jgi:hypothetical protein
MPKKAKVIYTKKVSLTVRPDQWKWFASHSKSQNLYLNELLDKVIEEYRHAHKNRSLRSATMRAYGAG